MYISRVGGSSGLKSYSGLGLNTKKGLTKRKAFKKTSEVVNWADMSPGELTSDIYPPVFQRNELCHFNNCDYGTEAESTSLYKRLLCCQRNKIKPQERKHNSERARKNWKFIKSNLLAELFIKKLNFGQRKSSKNHDNESLSDEEEVKTSWTENLIIHPNSKKVYFDYLMSYVALIDLLVNIYCIFVAEPSVVFNLLVLPLFVLEMILCSLTTFYVDVMLENRIVYIIKNYLKNHFLLDFIGTFPFFLFNIEFLSFKLMRIFKLTTYISRINSFTERILTKCVHDRRELINSVKKTIRFLIFLTFTMHLLACIWIYIGHNYEDNWIEKGESILEDSENNLTLYIAANYWVMSTFTTVGYGDFSGLNNTEYLFNMLVQVLGIGFFGYTIDSISRMMGQIDSISEFQEQEEEKQNIWLMKLGRSNKDKILSRHYFDHANSFFSNYWSMDFKTLKNHEFYTQLKPQLQIEVDNNCFEEVYDRFEGFFYQTQQGFKREICHNLVFEEFRIFPPYTDSYEGDKKSFPDKQKTLLLKDGEMPDRIFFFVGGEAYASNSTGRYNYFQLPEGAYFGDTHVLIGLPMSYSLFYNSEIGCAALTIKADIFLNICKRYPDSFAKLRKRSEQRRRVLRTYKFEALSDIINSSIEKFKGAANFEKIRGMYDLLLNENKENEIVKEARNRISILKTLEQGKASTRSSRRRDAITVLKEEQEYKRNSINFGNIPEFGRQDIPKRKFVLPEISQVIDEESKNFNTSENLFRELEDNSLNEGFDKNLDKNLNLMPDKIEMSEYDSPLAHSNLTKKKSILNSSQSDNKFIQMMENDKTMKRTLDFPEKTRGSAALTDENFKLTHNNIAGHLDELITDNQHKNLGPDKVEDSDRGDNRSENSDKERIFFSGGSDSSENNSSIPSSSSSSSSPSTNRRRSMPNFRTRINLEEVDNPRSARIREKFFQIHQTLCNNSKTSKELFLKNEICEEYCKDEPNEINIVEEAIPDCIQYLLTKYSQKDHSVPNFSNYSSNFNREKEDDQRAKYSELLSIVQKTSKSLEVIKEKYKNSFKEEQDLRRAKFDQAQAKIKNILSHRKRNT
ncbi:unnamed protein product [Moneuplotes crassus]|uniref:Cyclic nucleotide-binding domain-containing protein n=1 Tax=Euplotes crassus TaxID=5936 RepID=A0AAD1URL0_EUPCR|nr:unnamed protein product [Moneuplotes crassus]